jgi:DNA-binding NtrC family response regulator
MLVEWLSKMGHEAIGITGGKDAAHWVTNHKCDVVLLDLKLPDANGLSLIAPIRQASPTTKVIVITGIEGPALAVNAVKEGASHYLTKPIDFAALAQALRELSRSRTNIVPF